MKKKSHPSVALCNFVFNTKYSDLGIQKKAELDYRKYLTDTLRGAKGAQDPNPPRGERVDIRSLEQNDVEGFCLYKGIAVKPRADISDLDQAPEATVVYRSPVGKFHIVMPELEEWGYRKFYIAMYLGHIELHTPRKRKATATAYLDSKIDRKTISQATSYAYGLLLPHRIMEPLRNAKRSELRDFANKFTIDIDIIRARLSELYPRR